MGRWKGEGIENQTNEQRMTVVKDEKHRAMLH